MTIRAATIADVTVIRNIATQTWWPTYSPILSTDQITYMLSVLYSKEKINHQIASGEQTFLLLTNDTGPVAFAAYSPREEDPGIYKLHKLYCLPQTQGKRNCKQLINEVIARTLKNPSICVEQKSPLLLRTEIKKVQFGFRDNSYLISVKLIELLVTPSYINLKNRPQSPGLSLAQISTSSTT